MPPVLALLLCLGFIWFAYRIDRRQAPDVSAGLWVPLIWVLIIGSRPISLWFNLGPAGYTESEGSPLDASIYLVLIIAACLVLAKRHINWSAFAGRNQIFIVLFLYICLSVLWTDDPFVSFKRLIKMVGMPVMALVVLTEREPVVAIKTLARRSAYVLIPLSLILNKYFFSLAVRFDSWSGAMEITGVTESKNMLGQLCFVISLVLIWAILTSYQRGEHRSNRRQMLLDGFVFLLAVYLLLKSNSATSKVCLLIGVAVLLCGHLRLIRWRIATFLILGAITFAILQGTFGIHESMAAALNRDPTLTNRTDIWQELWSLRGNTLIGTGYEAFWTGERLTRIWETRHINESHNGYLEIFLNLGAIGLSLWLLFIVAAYKNCKRRLIYDYELGRISIALFTVAVVYNMTEAGFKGLSFMLFLFFLIALDVSDVCQVESVDEVSSRLGYPTISTISD
jgi:exopolysaccharide production protein ExoQ